MKTRLWNIWDRISGSFWFLPAFLVTVAAAMALSAALSRLAQREIPSSVRTDQNGHPRFIAFHATFPDALAAAYDQIRQNPSNTPSLNMRLLEGLERIARKAHRRTDREAIRQQADLVFASCTRADYLADDLQGVRQQYERVCSALDTTPQAQGDSP